MVKLRPITRRPRPVHRERMAGPRLRHYKVACLRSILAAAVASINRGADSEAQLARTGEERLKSESDSLSGRSADCTRCTVLLF